MTNLFSARLKTRVPSILPLDQFYQEAELNEDVVCRDLQKLGLDPIPLNELVQPHFCVEATYAREMNKVIELVHLTLANYN